MALHLPDRTILRKARHFAKQNRRPGPRLRMAWISARLPFAKGPAVAAARRISGVMAFLARQSFRSGR
jgi:hypothetical protein